MAAPKPVFVFIPGSFQGPPHFELIVKALGARGYEAFALALPGVGDDAGTAPPLQSVETVRSKIKELVVNDKKEVVLVGCSYGGFVASMSVKGFQKAAGTSDGRAGVKCIVFISALVIPEGMTIVSALGGSLPPWAELDQEKGILNPSTECGSLFFSDLDESAQKHWASFFKPQSPRDSLATVKDSCWDVDVPKTYVYTTKDKTSTLEMQKTMVEQVAKARANDWLFETMDTDHSPFLSHVEDMAAVLEKCAQ